MDHLIDEPQIIRGTGQRAAQTDNFLLQNLAPADFAMLRPHLERVPFRTGEALARAGEPIDSVCFPEGAIAGIIDALDGDHRFAVGLVGQEGFVGWPLLLGDDIWPHDVVMRAEDGQALRLPARVLMEAVDRSDTLRRTLLRFTNVMMLQMSRTIVSSLAHSIERRMARWILLYHDRVRADEICMTHEEFRLMLGVRRSSVTDALHRLEEEQAVRTSRGRVIVADRGKLLDLAGDTYGRAEREYRRLIIGNAP
ncbi:Crp/Fnr family transcriptional regulator [Sphingomonas sp. CLY1604]|uniref:Crp/Fnr family transcriptional regulator n=1 Tax=Sphingomonas sp. CLY1604 TaxID=3457786 RepID=UPI003FD720D8